VMTKVNMGDLLNWNTNNYNGDLADLTEKDISSVEVYRIRLAYNDCNGAADAIPVITFKQKQLDGAGNVVTDANGKTVYEEITWSGNDIQLMHSYEDPYSAAAADADSIIYVPETGEVLFGKNRYETVMATKDDASTSVNEAEIRITYQKQNWLKGDLRPEHYFYCESEGVKYNSAYLEGDTERQDIEYDIGFNQTIRVNSTADECFQHGIGREADDLVSSMQDVLDVEKVIADIKKRMETTDGEDLETLERQLQAAEKAYTLAKDKCQKLFEQGITTFQGYLDDANLCVTNCGTRSSKLELVKNRMQSQKTTFETLKSENEDVDITEVAIQLSSAELTYEAALMATGKVMQTTLLNFI